MNEIFNFIKKTTENFSICKYRSSNGSVELMGLDVCLNPFIEGFVILEHLDIRGTL